MEALKVVPGFNESTQLAREGRQTLALVSRTAEAAPYLLVIASVVWGPPVFALAGAGFLMKAAYEVSADHRRQRTGNIRHTAEEVGD